MAATKVKPANKSAVFQALAESTGLTKKQVSAVFDGLTEFINHEVGKNYVNAQKGLPDTITVTGSANSSESGSTGATGTGEP